MRVEYAKVNARGQVVIPADIRRKFGIEQGTRVASLERDGELIFQPITDAVY